MKKLLTSILATALIAVVPLTATANDYNNTNIPIGQSGQAIKMIGTIKPTIMSVTMPSAVPFDISKSVAGDNKVVSPRIKIKNNSNVDVVVTIGDASVDISKLKNTYWSDNGYISSNNIAIGFKNEEITNTTPTDIWDAIWIKDGYNNKKIMDIKSTGEGYTYVVGRIGNDVPEDSTFSVVPIFVVTQAN